MALSTGAAINIASLMGTGASAGNMLKGNISSGGSVNSSQNSSKSVSNSWSNTAGNLASERARLRAAEANANARDAWESAADYNARQAQVQRDWEEYMSNTQYQRAVQDMIKAGLNPILAAGNGISGASIGSGAAASMSAPETFMGQTYAEQNSASHSESASQGSSSGNSWQNSESGLATGLKLMGDSIQGALQGLNSSTTVNLTLDALKQAGKKVPEAIEKTAKGTAKATKSVAQKVVDFVKKDWKKHMSGDTKRTNAQAGYRAGTKKKK